MFRHSRVAVPIGVLIWCAGVPSARADLAFSFNTLSSGASSNSIASYMNVVIGCPSCVTVSGAVADRTYNGDGHVTGPGTGKYSLTLGTSDGATASNSNSALNKKTSGAVKYDTFIANTNDSSHQVSNQIVIKFGPGYALNGIIGFDYEIFPDISGNPDFIFEAWSGSTLVKTWTQYGVKPGTTNGAATHSPLSGSSRKEASNQYIGTWSSGAALSNITELRFIDWPATIGVDNLAVTRVPERGCRSICVNVLRINKGERRGNQKRTA